MSEKFKEIADIPQQFVRDGNQVDLKLFLLQLHNLTLCIVHNTVHKTLTKRLAPFMQAFVLGSHLSEEFVQICKAVAIGFSVMGFIGYFVKLIHIPMSVVCPFYARSAFAHELRQKQYSCVCFNLLSPYNY
jgi:protein transport protein SEC61 subunit gamma-like protein